jgi:hypothetical protein
LTVEPGRNVIDNLQAMTDRVTDQHLRYIAARNYGVAAEAHWRALNALIARGCVFVSGDYWFPYEVIELCAHHREPGHDYEFALCTLLVIRAVRSGFDRATDLSVKFSDRAVDYSALPYELSERVLAAYVEA